MIITDVSKLRKINSKVSIEEAKEIIPKLEKDLVESERPGIGLAACQIGIHKQVAIVRITGEEDMDLVNPILIEKWGSFINKDEGCLSLPNKTVNTNRHKEIFVKDDLHPAGFVATGLAAIAIVHEIDHIQNILITDRRAGKGKIKRNDPCPCGKMKNGRFMKWKECHGKE